MNITGNVIQQVSCTYRYDLLLKHTSVYRSVMLTLFITYFIDLHEDLSQNHRLYMHTFLIYT